MGSLVDFAGRTAAVTNGFVTSKDGYVFDSSLWMPSGRWYRLKKVKLPKYVYSFSERMTAAESSRGGAAAVADALRADMVAAFGLNSSAEIDQINTGALPAEVAVWVNENRALIQELTKAPSTPTSWWDFSLAHEGRKCP